MGRPVAIKFIKPELSANPKVRKRFISEARALGKMQHNNVVQVFDVGLSKDGRLLMELELVEGSSLAQHLRDKGKLSITEAVGLSLQVCAGLALVHQKGIIHRDIKPSNILLTKDGVPKLGDFGLAQDTLANLSVSREGQVLGTPLYMSPEQRAGQKIDHRSDLYNLAVTVYEMVTGEAPHVIRLDRIEPGLRVPLSKCLEESPANRFQSAEDLIAALRQVRPVAVSGAAGEELARGQCRWCGHINDSRRKVCDDPQCRKPLREKCLSCATENRVWERVCDGCGENLRDVVANRRAAIASEKITVESLLGNYDYAKAIERLEPIAHCDHPQLLEQTAWARAALTRYKAELADHEERRKKALSAARECYEAMDDRQAIAILEGIPHAFRNPGVTQLLSQAQKREADAEEMRSAIRTHLKNLASGNTEDRLLGVEARTSRYSDVKALIERLLVLRPSEKNATKLLRQLTQKEEAEKSHQLAKEISSALASKDYVNLKPKVLEYLQLSPTDQKAQQLRERLDKWEQRRLEKDEQERKRREDELQAIREKEQAARRDERIRQRQSDEQTAVANEWVEEPNSLEVFWKTFWLAVGAAICSFIGAVAGLFAGMIVGSILWLLTCGTIGSTGIGVVAVICTLPGSIAGCALVLSGEAKKAKEGRSVHPDYAVPVIGVGSVALAFAVVFVLVHLLFRGREPVQGALKEEPARPVAQGEAGPVPAPATYPRTREPNVGFAGGSGGGSGMLGFSGGRGGAPPVAPQPTKETNKAPATGGNELHSSRVAYKPKHDLTGHTDQIRGLSITADGKRAVSGSKDTTIRVWDTDRGVETHTLKGHTGSVDCVAISANGKRVISGGNDKTIRIWDAEKGTELFRWAAPSGLVTAVAMSADGKRAASSGYATVNVWDAEKGVEIMSIPGYTTRVTSVAMSADGNRVVSGSGLGGPGSTSGKDALKVWDAGRGVRTLQLPTRQNIFAVAVTSDGKRIVSCNSGRELEVWDAEREVKTLTLSPPRGSRETIRSVGISADGKRVTCIVGKTLMIWDAATGAQITSLPGSGGGQAVSISSDGKRVVSVGLDTAVKVWDAAAEAD
jgi:serine/threonine protein kinase/WD40 repeat protein